MHPIYQRMAELTIINQNRRLNDKELDEMSICLKENAKICWEAAYVENIALMDSMVKDIDWEHETCLDDDTN